MSTIKEIAKRSGVSVATVAHILGNKRDLHSKATQSLVLSVSQQLGYKPSSSAMATKLGRFHCATLLLSTKPSQAVPLQRMLPGILNVLEARGYHLNIMRLSDEQLSEAVHLPKYLTQWMTDGILVHYTHDIPEWLVERIHQDRAPAVWINSNIENECARPDDHQAGYDSTRHLIDLGHKRIVYAVHYTHHYSTQARGIGYAAAMEGAGLRPRWELLHVDTSPEWVAAATQWFREPDRPTAVVAYGLFPGLPIAHAAFKGGLRIPEDLSICMFEPGQAEDISTGNKFTTWYVPQYEVGLAAAQKLLEMIDCPTMSVGPSVVPFTMMEDLSTAKSPS